MRHHMKYTDQLSNHKNKTIQEWDAMGGVWPELHNTVGSIDGTSHEIYRPIVEPQEQYYLGMGCHGRSMA